jgi:hypothetical protein
MGLKTELILVGYMNTLPHLPGTHVCNEAQYTHTFASIEGVTVAAAAHLAPSSGKLVASNGM